RRGSKRRHHAVGHLRGQLDKRIYGERERQPADGGKHARRLAVRHRDAHSRHRRQTVDGLRRPGWRGRYAHRAAEHYRARVSARPRRPGRRSALACDPPGQATQMRPRDRDNVNLTLIALACALLMVLPLVTTFDDLLTAWALQLGVNNPLQAIVPVESRMIVGLLSAVGIKAAAAGSHMVVWDGSGSMHVLLISWNCIGWQSLVLLGVSFVSGLRGHQPLEARVQVVIIGVAGTMLL